MSAIDIKLLSHKFDEVAKIRKMLMSFQTSQAVLDKKEATHLSCLAHRRGQTSQHHSGRTRQRNSGSKNIWT